VSPNDAQTSMLDIQNTTMVTLQKKRRKIQYKPTPQTAKSDQKYFSSSHPKSSATHDKTYKKPTA